MKKSMLVLIVISGLFMGCQSFVSSGAYMTTLLECRAKTEVECDKTKQWFAVVTVTTPDKCADVLVEKIKLEKEKIFVCRPANRKYDVE